MNVYVAGAYCDKHTVQQVQAALIKTARCTITHDWTAATNTTALEDALSDERGVNRAELVVLVFSVAEHAYRGTFTEMGMALGLGKMIVALCLVDGEYRHNPFLQLPQVHRVQTLDELLSLVNAVPYEERLRLFLKIPVASERNYVPIHETDSDSEGNDDQTSAGDTCTGGVL